MKISAIRERTVSLASGLRNAGVAYDSMTASSVVVEADGGALCGLGFDSVGRYGHGARPCCANASSRGCSMRNPVTCWTPTA